MPHQMPTEPNTLIRMLCSPTVGSLICTYMLHVKQTSHKHRKSKLFGNLANEWQMFTPIKISGSFVQRKCRIQRHHLQLSFCIRPTTSQTSIYELSYDTVSLYTPAKNAENEKYRPHSACLMHSHFTYTHVSDSEKWNRTVAAHTNYDSVSSNVDIGIVDLIELDFRNRRD